MKIIIFTILFFISSPSWPFDHSTIKGQWAVYHKNLLSSDDYYFLNIKKDFSGTFIRSLGHEPIVREFNSNQITKQNGYVEIQLSEHEKAILSAWKSKPGKGRLTGVIYLYKQSGELFNTLYFSLHRLINGHKYLKYETIKNLSAKHR